MGSVRWQDTVEKCIQSIATIKATRVRSFDTDTPSAYTATGFVVSPGLILSNRHVVGAGPVVAQAVFANDEEIVIRPVYRDPIHDFGFFAYHPIDVQHLNIPSIPLAPDGAHVGQEIRVVGNNGGEKFSILSGTLANLRREAPVYGQGKYNDFNTFYMQASSGTFAGSSGSPVLDLQGRAIGLNCGGNTKNSAFYLPLHRVKHCLDRLLVGKPVHRGTLQTDFAHTSLHTLRQLGLPKTLDDQLSRDGQRGMLVVSSTSRSSGPSLLEPGDILWQVHGSIIVDFVSLESILDEHVNELLQVIVLRHGDLVSLTLRVQNLHHLTPSKYLELGGGIVHDISYQIARTFGIGMHQGVYVASAGAILGTASCGRQSIVTAFNNCPVTTLDSFVRIVQQVPSGAHVPIRYYSLTSRKERVMILHMDRRWHQTHLATRNDITGWWEYESVPTVAPPLLPPSPPCVPSRRNYRAADSIRALKTCIVAVDCYPPFVIDGIQTSHAYGAGVIVSLDPPRVVCDRDTVPTAMCSVMLTFRHKVTVPARPVFLHPYHNYVVLAFDSVPDDQVYYAHLDNHTPTCCSHGPGDRVHYVGLDGNNDVKHAMATVASVKNVRTHACRVPRYRAINVEAIYIDDPVVNGQGGLLAIDSGHSSNVVDVVALWMTFETGEDSLCLQPRRAMAGLLTCYVAPLESAVWHLDIEFWTMQLAHARQLGLEETDLNSAEQSKVLYVMDIMRPDVGHTNQLKVGDIVLRINDQPVSGLADLVSSISGPTVSMAVFRENAVLQLEQVPTTMHDGHGTTAVVGWQGLLVQEPHLAATEQVCGEQVPHGVYVSCCLHGSPAQMVLKAGIWITAMDRLPVPTLTSFLEAAVQLEANEFVRVTHVSKDNITSMSILRIDRHYWPTWSVQKDASSGWQLLQQR
ncbi:hypothetical protein BX666DRAFT_2029999 [Dichotomocladium elegans]|nr:hypothetical protein BX666DRAFT_2029999 [Dichotomocladium elegans]